MIHQLHEKGGIVGNIFLRIFASLILLLALGGRIGDLAQVYPKAAASEYVAPIIKNVRVGYVEAPCFMQGMSDDAVKSGLAYDYLQRVSYYTNWRYVYVYGDWATILDKLYKGEVDVMAGVSKTPERAGKMLFPDYAMGTENYYIYVHTNHPLAMKGLAGLHGHTVSVNQNTIMSDLLQSWNQAGNYQLNILTYSGNDSRYRDFKANLADATVDTDNAVQEDTNMVPFAWIGQSDYYLAVTKNRPDLVNDLNTALNKIITTNPRFVDKLANTYFSKLAVVANLSGDEMDWINHNPMITIGYVDDYLPLSDRDDKGQVEGIFKDIFQEIVQKLNIQDKVRFSFVPFDSYDEMLRALADGSIYAAFPVNSDVQQAEKQGIFLSSDVITTPMYLIYTGDYANLNLRRIGVKRENSIGDIYVRSHYPHMEMIYYDDIHDMLDAVKRGAVDGCILNQFRRDAYLIRAGYRDLQSVALKDYISLSFAVKKGNSELLSILNRGITRLPSDFALTSTYAYTGMMAPMTFRDYLLENLLTVMLAIGIIIAILSSLVAYIFLIHRNKREMQYIAQHDGLTGLLNRHCYNDFLNARQQDYPQDNLVVISMDLNGLKGVNDTMGHEAGDELIMGAAGCMKEALSAYGSVYRTGGDEFVAIIETPQQGLPKIIQSLKERFDNWHGKWNKSMSVSLGTAHNSDSSRKKLHELLALADQEMYKDKAAYYSRLGIDRRRH